MKPNSDLTIREVPAASSSSLHSIIDQALNPFTSRQIAGPLREGHYIQISLGMGFYVPEAAFRAAQQRATATSRIQFLGVARDGRVLEGDRETILAHPDSAGLVAWIVPGQREDPHQNAPVSDGFTDQRDEDEADQEYCDRAAGIA